MRAEKMIGKKLDGYLVEEHSVQAHREHKIIGIKIDLSPERYIIYSFEYDQREKKNFVSWKLISKNEMLCLKYNGTRTYLTDDGWRAEYIGAGTWQFLSKELIWEHCNDEEKGKMILLPFFHTHDRDDYIK